MDIIRASKNRQTAWAQNTSRHTVKYLAEFSELTLSAFTVFEVLDGLHRSGVPGAAKKFIDEVLPNMDVIYPDKDIFALGAEINAALTLAGKGIGVVDTIIAATAISQKLVLVNANTKHFSRIQASGFKLQLENWREI